MAYARDNKWSITPLIWKNTSAKITVKFWTWTWLFFVSLANDLKVLRAKPRNASKIHLPNNHRCDANHFLVNRTGLRDSEPCHRGVLTLFSDLILWAHTLCVHLWVLHDCCCPKRCREGVWAPLVPSSTLTSFTLSVRCERGEPSRSNPLTPSALKWPLVDMQGRSVNPTPSKPG